MTNQERIAELEAALAQQREQIATLLEQHARLVERVRELEARLAKDSHNSSKPPSLRWVEAAVAAHAQPAAGERQALGGATGASRRDAASGSRAGRGRGTSARRVCDLSGDAGRGR